MKTISGNLQKPGSRTRNVGREETENVASVNGLDADVAIVGFGPVGATLAALLGRRGVRVAVVERDPDVYPLPRAAHIDHQGLRLLQEIGCLDPLIPDMMVNPGIDFTTADGELLVRIPGDIPSVSGLPASMYFFQPPFDRAARETAASFPTVDVRLEREMTGFEQMDDHVRVDMVAPDGTKSSLTASWLVGCDGAWSPVRETAGIKLDDLEFHENWIVVDLLLKRDVPSLPRRAVTVCDPARPTTMIPIPGNRFRIEMQVMEGDGTPEEVQKTERILELVSPWVPADAVEVERSAVYNFHGLVARPWKVGRVLVAGDAAHQMPPFLGQGMCSGLRDAGNLAWKLDHVIRLGASESLLDTYEQERRPHVTAIVKAAVEFGRITCITDPAEAAERDRRWLVDSRPAARRLPFSLPDLQPGPLVLAGGGELFIQPESPAGDGTRLDDVVGQRFLVVSADGQPNGRWAGWWSQEVGALVTEADALPGGDQIKRWLATRKADVAVIRPDRYVMATGKSLDDITPPVAMLAGELALERG
jgi:3-(3-hydroxy-phenyl)propionate hydroxylase